MHIACSINKNYIPHMCAMLLSVRNNTNAKEINVHILHADLDSESQSIILSEFSECRVLKFNFYKVDKTIFNNVPIVAKHLKVETLYRLLLPFLIPNHVNKILYIDSDIIVKGDLLNIWSQNIENYYIGAVINSFEDEMYKRLDLESPLDYFNAGFILINLAKWRDESLFEDFMKFAESNLEKLYFADQDILNGVFKGQWLRFHPQWNVQNGIYENKDWFIKNLGEKIYIETIEQPKVIHFSGPLKPWNLISSHVLTDEYYIYANQLRWKQSLPYGLNENMYKGVYIYGTGALAQIVCNSMIKQNIPIIGYLDSDNSKWGRFFNDKEIFSPDKILSENSGNIQVIIASSYYSEILEKLKSYNNKNLNITSIN